ncbi:DEKNAAC104522 [Brettanomyces naardenensis]|uniref:DEKNAAC104522 n=1 Tax=Brettanomyces naardenensis TaxID=13370 RepID=A0A448YR21_BRENA|nr:DEKNAAC104522 [Brettanomyces naardenensis]
MAPNNGAAAASKGLQEDVRRFQYDLESKRKDGPRFNEAPLLDREDEEFSAGGSNRGNKSLYNSDTVNVSRLNSSRDNLRLVRMQTIDQTKGQPVAKLVLQDKRISLDELVKNELDDEYGSISEGEDGDYDDDAQRILESIDLADILGPITSPSDVVSRKSISTIYRSNHLAELAEETIHIIEKEQDNVNQLSKLMNVFLGDDPSDVYADALGLQNYDHHLDLVEEMNNDSEQGQSKGETNANGEASTAEKDEDTTQDDEDDTINQKNSHVVSNEASNRLIDDPFFQLPQYKRDFNFGIRRKEDAEEARQLIQIALQRNEEFIRSLSSIRMGFIKAERLKDNIFRWCKELDEAHRHAQKEDGAVTH